MNFIENCRRVISCESTSLVGNVELVGVLQELCRGWGLDVELQPEMLNSIPQANIIVRVPGAQQGPELMLQASIDTEDPGPYGLWSKTDHNPFHASIINGEIFGLGAASGKLDFLCKLEALKVVSQAQVLKKPVVVVGTYGHRQGMAGAIKLVRRKRIKADVALIGAPTDLYVVDAGTGFAELECDIPFSKQEMEYQRKHDLMESSSTQSKIFQSIEGDRSFEANPIIKLLDYLSHLPEGIAIMDIEGGASANTYPRSAILELDMVDTFEESILTKLLSIRKILNTFPQEFRKYIDEGFQPPFSTLNIGRIDKKSDHIKINGTCRLLPSVSASIYEEWIERVHNACKEVSASFRVIDHKQPFFSNIDSSFCRHVLNVQNQKSGIRSGEKYSDSNEASIFSRLGVECMVYGAGCRGDIGGANEKVSITSLEKSIEFYKQVIAQVCL